jgi:DNA repair protein RAD5
VSHKRASFHSQWQTEIERYTPHLSVKALHNEETPALQDVATTDIVLASTFLLTQGPKKGKPHLYGFLKRIHWHRLIVDEAHYNQQGHTIKKAIASLSSTHRVSITGTPIGSQLSDLHGQLRFLRLAPFHRPDFWENNIQEPYCSHDPEALRVLRSLLSHVVIRHSKEQTFSDGRFLVPLPPRNVEQVLLDFGSDEERELYCLIESRNRGRFLELKQDSVATVASKYLELNSLLMSARQACAHTSIIDLRKMHQWRERVDKERQKKLGFTETVELPSDAEMTRKDVLELAVSRARPSAVIRMRLIVDQFQHGFDDLLECPICFEVSLYAIVVDDPVLYPTHPFHFIRTSVKRRLLYHLVLIQSAPIA